MFWGTGTVVKGDGYSSKGAGTVVKGDGYSSKVNVGMDARTPSASPA